MVALDEGRRRESFQSDTAAVTEKTMLDTVKMKCSTYSSLFAQFGPTMTPDDASEPLHMHPATVRRLCAEGKLPAVRFGKRWVISTSLLAHCIDGEEI